MNWRSPLTIPIAVCIALGAIGLATHFFFSIEAGRLTFFTNAFDEGTYFLLLDQPPRLDRLISHGFLTFVRANFSDGATAAFVLSDTLLIPLAFLAAYHAMGALFPGAPQRAFWALFILLAPDIFSLGSSASPTSYIATVSDVRSLLGEQGQLLIPPYETSYLNVLRTPEPQIAYILVFLFLGCLLRAFVRPTMDKKIPWLGAILVLQVALTGAYSIVTYPVLALSAYSSLIFLAFGRRWISAILLFGLVLCASLVLTNAASTVSDHNLAFASRLPTVTPSIVLGMLLAIWLAIRIVAQPRQPLLWLALGCALLPVAIMNQQIVTGMMVSAKDWERNVTCQLVALSCAILAAGRMPATTLLTDKRAGVALAALVLFAGWATEATYRNFLSTNRISYAMSDALGTNANTITGSPLVIDPISAAPSVAVRRNRKLEILLSHTSLFIKPIPKMNAASFQITNHGRSVFRYWRFKGMTESDALAALTSDIYSKRYYYIPYFFNVCQYWGPCADNRVDNNKEIQEIIPKISGAYQEWLRAGRFDQDVRYVVAIGGEITTPAGFVATPLNFGEIGGTMATLFEIR